MREIKFRAWDSYQNKMIQWEELINPNVLSIWNLLNGLIEHIKPMQFTGLKDKNGKEVYEGDIYEYKRSEQEKQKDFYKTRKVVIFSNGSFGFQEWHTDENGRLRDMLLYIPGQITNREFYYIDFDLEVIGNIHQDKELIES